MPDYTDIVTQVTSFAADYVWAIVAGVIVSLMAWGLRKMIKAGR